MAYKPPTQDEISNMMPDEFFARAVETFAGVSLAGLFTISFLASPQTPLPLFDKYAARAFAIALPIFLMVRGEIRMLSKVPHEKLAIRHVFITVLLSLVFTAGTIIVGAGVCAIVAGFDQIAAITLFFTAGAFAILDFLRTMGGILLKLGRWIAEKAKRKASTETVTVEDAEPANPPS